MNNSTNANGANFDPYLTWLGIRDPQRPPNHYRLLGLEVFEDNSDVIAAAADRQMTYVRTYQAGQQGEHSQRILNELTTAKLCLLKPERKRDYDERLRAAQKPSPAPLPPMQPMPAPARPYGAAPGAHPHPQPMYPSAAPRPLPVQHAPAASPFEDNSPFGPPPVSVHGPNAAALPAKNNAAMQWSIVGGLVLATIILAVVLANKFGGSDPQPTAHNTTPAKVTTTAVKNTNKNPNVAVPPENNKPKDPNTETTEPNPTEPKNTEPKNTEPKNNETKTSVTPNGAQPGNETVTPPVSNPMNPAPMNPSPMNPVPAVTPSNPAPNAVAMTNKEPMNAVPPVVENPAMPVGPTPMTDPTNPLGVPDPTEPTPEGEMPKPAQRKPAPTAKEIAENRANVREVFKSDYATRDLAALTALGKRLHKMAQESAGKPAMMYTALDEARVVSAQVNDLETTFSVHDEISREFAVDRDKDLIETIKLVAKSAPTMNAENAGSVLDLLQESITGSILEQRLDTAEQLLRFVTNFSGRVPDKAAREIAFRDLQKKLGEHKSFASKAKEYKETLAKNPNDGDANLELGKFWAFQQGNFEQGLSFLAKGSDAEIREAAKREMTLKPDAPDYVKVADGWWEVANKLPADPRSTVKIHAAYTYARALPNLKALDRGLAESRINEAYKLFKPNNREVKELMKALLSRATWKMEWKGRTPNDPTLGFSPTGECTCYEYPMWKLLDNGYVVAFRDRSDRFGPPPGFGGRFGGFGRGQNNNNDNNNGNNNNNSGPKPQDLAKNVMQIAVTANRIEIRVLGNDGDLRGTGTGIPE